MSAAVAGHNGRFLHLADVVRRPGYMTVWEYHRHRRVHWFAEAFAEAMGVFMYVYAGVGSTAAYVIGTLVSPPNVGLTGLSSIQQVGFAYMGGIIAALIICAPTSGGHISPAITICNVVRGQFPARKAPLYIVAQILGGYIACLLAYSQWKTLILEVEAGLKAAGKFDAVAFTPQGTAGIFGLYLTPGSNLGRAFLNEFVTDFFIGIVIWSCLDPTNFLVLPHMGPVVIGLTYAVAIWGYSPNGLAANTARDLAGRLAVLTIYGTKAAGGKYAAISALTNIPATMLAMVVYDFMFMDSSRVITPAARDQLEAHAAHAEHSDGRFNSGIPRFNNGIGSHSTANEKAEMQNVERA